jgi:hypothetical protein
MASIPHGVRGYAVGGGGGDRTLRHRVANQAEGSSLNAPIDAQPGHPDLNQDDPARARHRRPIPCLNRGSAPDPTYTGANRGVESGDDGFAMK